jgi:hypothetical protein
MDINDAGNRIAQLKKSIIDLCESLHKDMSENKLDKIEKIFSRRQELIDELFSLTKTRVYADEIMTILNWVHEQDRIILNTLFKERDKIKLTIDDLTKTKRYLTELS